MHLMVDEYTMLSMKLQYKAIKKAHMKHLKEEKKCHTLIKYQLNVKNVFKRCHPESAGTDDKQK